MEIDSDLPKKGAMPDRFAPADFGKSVKPWGSIFLN